MTCSKAAALVSHPACARGGTTTGHDTLSHSFPCHPQALKCRVRGAVLSLITGRNGNVERHDIDWDRHPWLSMVEQQSLFSRHRGCVIPDVIVWWHLLFERIGQDQMLWHRNIGPLVARGKKAKECDHDFVVLIHGQRLILELCTLLIRKMDFVDLGIYNAYGQDEQKDWSRHDYHCCILFNEIRYVVA